MHSRAPATHAWRGPLSLRWFEAAIAGGVALLPTLNVVSQAGRASYRDYLDVYLNAMNVVPLIPVYPLVIMAMCAIPAYHRGLDRQFVNERLRGKGRTLILGWVLRGAMIPAIAFACGAVLAGMFAFWVAPELTWISVDAGVYGLDAASLASDQRDRSTFTSLFAGSPVGFVVVYATWVAAVAAVVGVASVLSVLWLRQRVIALTGVWIVFLGQTIIAAMLGRPTAGLQYSAYPAGFAPFPSSDLCIPLLALVALLACGLVAAIRAPERLAGWV